MKKGLRIMAGLVLGMFVCCATGSNSARSVVDVKVPDSKKRVISVMKFEDRSVKTKEYAPWSMGIPDMIMESLGAIPYYKVISREDLVNTVMKEQEFQLLGFTDPDSAEFLDGLEIDYSDDLIRSGFRFKNPRAGGSCGCGSSFKA